ncbi:MAG TPA: hypothetical protein VK966_11815, partial [Longimicrobiales bacterium]|nr:hypothetical protein [Longimicrobiales bacterium]
MLGDRIVEILLGVEHVHNVTRTDFIACPRGVQGALVGHHGLGPRLYRGHVVADLSVERTHLLD